MQMRKSLGDKRREIPRERAEDILKILEGFQDGDTRTVTKDGEEEEVVVRDLSHNPLRLSKDHGRAPAPAQLPGYVQNVSPGWKRRGLPGPRAVEEERRRGYQRTGRGPRPARSDSRASSDVSGYAFKDRDKFESMLTAAARKAGVKLPAPIQKAILSALSERDETAAICRDKDGRHPSPIRSFVIPRMFPSRKASMRFSSER